MRFKDIIGHDLIKERLRNMADSGHIPHALLFEGPEGVGKLAMARAFAQYVHCEHRMNGEPCGTCPSCLQHQTFNHADLFFVFPIYKKTSGKDSYCDDFISEWREFLSENVYADFGAWVKILNPGTAQPIIYNNEGDAILRKISVKSYSARYRIMILWLPEKMNTECANRLLKMIEEPFDDTLLFFVSNTPESILPTIYSRMQRLAMKRHPMETVASYLSEMYATDPQNALAIANIAEGSITTAESLLRVDETNRLYLEYFKRLMRSAYKRDVRDLKIWSEEVADMKREQCRKFLEYTAKLIRENFIYNLQNRSLNFLTKEEEDFSARFFPFVNERNIATITMEIDRAASDISRNANGKIVLFDFAIKMILAIKM